MSEAERGAEEVAAIVSAFHAYATHNGTCQGLLFPSTDERYRCACGLIGWARRADALAALAATPLSEGEDWVRCPHDDDHSMTGGRCDICQYPRPEAVPEGWTVEWVDPASLGDGPTAAVCLEPIPRLVPSPPPGEPDEGERYENAYPADEGEGER